MPKDERDTSWFHYVCSHQAANEPCAKGCHATPGGQPDAAPVADDWLGSAGTPGGGIADSTSLGGAAVITEAKTTG